MDNRVASLLVFVALSIALVGFGAELGNHTGFLSFISFSGGYATDYVTCQFDDPTAKQECHAGNWSCEGKGACTVKVLEKTGTTLSWGSLSCLGRAYTVVDGIRDTIRFPCGTQVKERVTCSFNGSTKEQRCYSPKGECKGAGRCSVQVQGRYREPVDWRASCGPMAGAATPAPIRLRSGGSGQAEAVPITGVVPLAGASPRTPIRPRSGDSGQAVASMPRTTIDGRNEVVEFMCAGDVSEQVTCVFLSSKAVEECKSEKGSCKGVGSCAVRINGFAGENVVWKASCGTSTLTTVSGKDKSTTFKCG